MVVAQHNDVVWCPRYCWYVIATWHSTITLLGGGCGRHWYTVAAWYGTAPETRHNNNNSNNNNNNNNRTLF